MENAAQSFEFIVVGSGPGGGVVAANLALAGFRVLLLEAGGDAPTMACSDQQRSVVDDYEVPAFHAFSSEHPHIRWDYFVHHYDDPTARARNPNHVTEHRGASVDGVLYPRAACLGGCSAHHAMISVYPHHQDWNGIADLMGDDSWRANTMRQYFQRIERCRHRFFLYRWLSRLGINWTGHGWNGWLPAEKSVPRDAVRDKSLVKVIKKCVKTVFDEARNPLQRLSWFFESQLDPNDRRRVDHNAEGVCYVPLTTQRHKRYGIRERLLDVQKRYPERLTIRYFAFATEVLFDDSGRKPRATGVRYVQKQNAYPAYQAARVDNDTLCEAHATREVIVAGGVFNTPQLLMLSGIGAAQSLAGHNIASRVDLPGVGRNLQDRYEVGIVSRKKNGPWTMLNGAAFASGDRKHRRWRKWRWIWRGGGAYTSNGGVLAVIRKSIVAQKIPDLFCLAFVADFRGYFPGYAKRIADHDDCLTWVVLKAHTNNSAGRVELNDANPLAPPAIRFRYFHEGNDHDGDDLKAVVDGVKFVRRLADAMDANDDLVEIWPGRDCDSDETIGKFVLNSAWGHHACGTCAMRPRSQNGVVDAHMRVYGTDGLRVVDASIFPKIPGFFIATPIMMAAEKASDMIIEAHRGKS